MVHKFKKGRTTFDIPHRTLEVNVAPTTATAKTMSWTIHRHGKTYTATRKKKNWSIKEKTIKRKCQPKGLCGLGKRVVKIKRKGALKELGYSTHASTEQRHEALRKAVRKYGTTTVFRMIQPQVIFRKRFPDHAKQTFASDRDYVVGLMSEKQRRALTAPAVKEWKSMTHAERVRARQ